ncbi:hypothetical protein CDD80_482 [Ophiocordyceps camponoti-rufipedis]|uniref:Protein PNS1 n=1 Tax=Ophiocordyceps camponoti-rufipedis TaxID=2004952 RepID=A0A2C5ZCM2_9HYPO|nr:hypothetical protein CDD80_482 [Ophiocordyceps camponoti-rufipedis]
MNKADGYAGQQQQQQYGQPQYGQQQHPQQQYGQQSYYYGGSNHDGQQPYPPQDPYGPPHDAYNQPQPSYAPPPPYSFNPPQPNDDKYSFEQAFKIDRPKYNDLWAGILFLVVFAGYVVISAISIRGWSTRGGSGVVSRNTVALFGWVVLAALILSYGYVWMARLFPKQFIWVTGILNLCFLYATAVYYLYIRSYGPGIIFLIMAVFTTFAALTWIKRIPFSALMLKTSVDVARKYGHVYLVSLLGGILGVILAAWYGVTVTAIYVRFRPDDNCSSAQGKNCSSGTVIGLIVYATFAMYWTSEWLKNTVHTTVSGVYGSWYFCPHNFPKAATRGAMKRALTYSFGSISLGSLLVAIVNMLRQICSIAGQQAANDGGVMDVVFYVISLIVGCLLSLLQWAIEFVNRYAFSYIALYGKAYFPAAKDTWTMIRDRGIDALVNECLIGPVLSFGAIFIGAVCTLLAFLFVRISHSQLQSNNGYLAAVMAFAFLVGFQIANIFTTPISSGIDTIFVASGWDPQVMYSEHPELYQDMVRVYPQVQQAIIAR